MNEIKIDNKFTLIITLLFYRFLLDFIYLTYLTEEWAYLGFKKGFNISDLLISFIPLITCIFFIQRRINYNKSSDLIILLINLITFIPTSSMLAYYPSNINFKIMIIMYIFILNIFQVIIPKFKFPVLKQKHGIILANSYIFLFVIVVLFISFRYTGFRLNLNLLNVYDLREESLNYNMPTILKYMFSASRIIIPVSMIYYLHKRKYTLFFLLLIVGLLNFSVNGQRSVFFSIILSIILYYTYSANLFLKLPRYILAFILLGLIGLFIFNQSLIIDIFVRRVMFVPNLLNYFYYDFFSVNQFDYLRQSIFASFGFQSPYSLPISLLIGMNTIGGNTNNGLFSDAYANFGAIGIIVSPLLIILMLRLYDSVSKYIDIRILIVSIIILTLNFISSFSVTIMLTHGFLALVILLFFINIRSNWSYDNE